MFENVSEIEVREVKEMIKFIKIDGIDYEAVELMGIIDALEGKDGFFTGVVINCGTLRDSLEQMKVISTNIRGSSCPSTNYKDFRGMLANRIYG